jgi:tRNA G10  N-methylase Trm11
MNHTDQICADEVTLPPSHDHPAMFSRELIEPLAKTIRGRRKVLDPFAGTGRIHTIAEAAGVTSSTGIELEREWANVDAYPGPKRLQIVGDSLKVLPTFRGGTFDAILTSPAYGNRMADKHDAKDSCKRCDGSGVVGASECKTCKGTGLSRRNTYRHRLGRPLSENNGGGLQWGVEYRDLHREVWDASIRVLRPGGVFVVNCSNHIRLGLVIDVCAWHRDILLELGLSLVEVIEVETRRQRHGANHHLRVAGEQIIVCERPQKVKSSGSRSKAKVSA